MSKEQSNQYRMELNGMMAVWTHRGSTIARLDMGAIPGIADALAAGGVLAGAVVLGITTRAKNAMAIPLDGRPRADVDREKQTRLREMVARLAANDWEERGNALLYLALQRLAEKGSASARKFVAEWVGLPADIRVKLEASATVQDEIRAIRRERDTANAQEDLISDLPEA